MRGSDDARMPRKLRQRLDREPGLKAELEERARESDGQPLCPACGVRPVNHSRTGFCRTCSYRRLSQAYAEREAEEEAAREYRRLKARAKRRTTCRECGVEYSPRLNSEGRVSDRQVCPSCREEEGDG